MRKTYKCSNIKFCMEDENQRRTWEHLQKMTRKDGSYGKILSDAFVSVLDGKIQIGMDKVVGDLGIPIEQDADVFGEMLDRALEQKFHEMLQEMQEVFADQIIRGFREYAPDFHFGTDNLTDKTESDGMGQMQEPELSEDMMEFAFAMGE